MKTMNKLIKIIKPYFPEMSGFEEELASDLANKLKQSGLVFENPIERMAAQFDDTQKRILDDTLKSQFSDGYHTFDELYGIRLAYNVALFNEWASQAEYAASGKEIALPKYDVHKSERHHDGELCFGGGWFIVVANLPSGQISNHYEMKHWDLFKIPVAEKAKYEWDVHTTEDVINRLKDS